MSKTIPIHIKWLADLLPEGWPVGTSTLITGPGGSGKPLIGNVIIDSWLRAGGGIVFMSLQYPEQHFAYESFKRVAGYGLERYNNNIVFIELDTSAKEVGPVNDHSFSANLVYPEQWNKAVNQGFKFLHSVPSDPGILIFGSALNLLFFSPTYRSKITETIIKSLKDQRFSCLFSVSVKPHSELVAKLESTVSNIIYSDKPGKEMSLFMEIKKMQGVQFDSTRIHIPIPKSELEATRDIAEHSRNRVIPEISRI
jgi:KaiC/GvpD/RAD55 family RecA-like ATPase